MHEKNTLAELAEDLEEIVKDTKSDFYTTRIHAAQRIVAELAKVPFSSYCYESFGNVACALLKCHEIAEEGSK